MMLYYSTNHVSQPIPFSQALLQGQAPDRGLYMPATIPSLSPQEIAAFRDMEYHQIAARVMGSYLRDELPPEVLEELARDAYNFDVPLEHVTERQYVMRLDQGPTASFKDFAARMMGRLINHYLQEQDRRLIILTATSGDTGSAISHAFLGLDRIRVVVLFPIREVTRRQRKQMSTLGQNIRVVAIDGKFDDCQALVKEAFADPDLKYLPLSSANSINIGRLIPQTVYYFWAYSRLAHDGEKITFSVPSGNFGDMMGGILAMKMGLPVDRFVIAVNENDAFPHYLDSGHYQKIEPSRNCISSAMNVGHPSNLARLVALYGGQMDERGVIHRPAGMDAMRRDIYAASINDEVTRNTIREAWQQHGLLLEPHGAVGWAGMQHYLRTAAGSAEKPLCVTLETAHPAKFPEEINQLLDFDPDLPQSLQGLDDKKEHIETIDNNYPTFKIFLMTKFWFTRD